MTFTRILRLFRAVMEYGIRIPISELFQYRCSALRRLNHKLVKKYLKKHYGDIASAPIDENSINSMGGNFPIWVMWWQGVEGMPPLVKTCFETLKTNVSGHPINLISEDNYKQYIDIPTYIIEKVKKKNISFTHLSDIIRICLLEKHGGLWLDSTILLSCPLNFNTNTKLFSIKTTNKYGDLYISRCRWSCFMIGASAGNPVMKRTKTIMFKILKKNNTLINHFFIDVIWDLLYSSSPVIKQLFDSIQKTNGDIYSLAKMYSTAFDERAFSEVLHSVPYHKLSNHRVEQLYTKNGELSVFGHIIRSESLSNHIPTHP